jgi:hypothetical protein
MPAFFISQIILPLKMNELLQHPALIPGVSLLVFLCANIWVYLRREWEANHRAVDYARINYPLDAPTLRKWKMDGNRYYPKIVWNKQPSHWQVMQNGQVIDTVSGNSPVITIAPNKFTGATDTALEDFTQKYTLRPLPTNLGPDINFSITPIEREFYATRGMDFPNDMILVTSDIPAGKFRQHSVGYWIDDYSYMGELALAEVDRIIVNEMGIKAEDADLVRMEKIVHFMRTKLIDAGGVPKNDFRWKNPLQIFQEMSQGTGKGWCTQNAQIYSLFANRAGVPTRFVYCGTVQNNQFVFDGHSWNESFLSEQKRWVYTDAQAIIVGVFDQQGRALNSADLFHLCLNGSFEGITARIFKNWLWQDLPIESSPDLAVDVPFSLVNRTAKNQATRHSIIKYRRPPNVEDVRQQHEMLLTSWTFAWANFRRYLYYYDLAYSNMPTQGETVYRLRQMLFGGLLGSIVWLLYSGG